MMCFKKCLYGTLLDGVQKGESGLARKEPLPPHPPDSWVDWADSSGALGTQQQGH